MGVNWAFFATVFLSFFAATFAVQCFKCGEYNDGVGSITPCINDTHMKLIDCPLSDHSFCIKYQSEGSIVRDCVVDCQEKETWGTKTFCCNMDGCNSSQVTRSTVYTVFAIVFMLLLAH